MKDGYEIYITHTKNLNIFFTSLRNSSMSELLIVSLLIRAFPFALLESALFLMILIIIIAVIMIMRVWSDPAWSMDAADRLRFRTCSFIRLRLF